MCVVAQSFGSFSVVFVGRASLVIERPVVDTMNHAFLVKCGILDKSKVKTTSTRWPPPPPTPPRVAPTPLRPPTPQWLLKLGRVPASVPPMPPSLALISAEPPRRKSCPPVAAVVPPKEKQLMRWRLTRSTEHFHNRGTRAESKPAKTSHIINLNELD